MGWFRAGAFHVLIAQEMTMPGTTGEKADATHRDLFLEHVVVLEQAGFRSSISDYGLVAARRSSCTHIERVRSLKDDPDAGGLIARVHFQLAHAGLTELTVASYHLHNVRAKKTVVSAEACCRFVAACVAERVDIIGYDIIQGEARLLAALELHGGAVVIRTPNTDCVGLVLPSTSQLLGHNVTAKYYNILAADLAWGPFDKDSHWMVAGHFRRPGTPTGARQRADPRAHNLRRDAARRQRQQAKAAAKRAPGPQ
jgi:hypothetical protein